MEWYEFYDIAERYMELINPTSKEKVVAAGKYLGLIEGQLVIDFGCGFAEPLALWAEHYGISGVGIDFREYAVKRAKENIAGRGLTDKIEIICGKGAEYEFEKNAYDVASCMGASFVWDGYQPTVKAMKQAIKPSGKMLIGEPYWRSDRIPPEYASEEKVHTEIELAQINRSEGFDIEYMIRSSDDDWTHYEATNWRGLIAWLEENRNHPARQEVIDWFKKTQDDYFRYGREYLGFALYILNPRRY